MNMKSDGCPEYYFYITHCIDNEFLFGLILTKFYIPVRERALDREFMEIVKPTINMEKM